MKTKLVYVLTCAPEATYIEQALMAVWSARHWNPDAHIVLMVDDKTEVLLKGKRGEINDYISEKIVVPFEDETLSPMYRSRWIKTQVRQMIEGDFLFVDCDTICCRSLAEVDEIAYEVAAVGDDNTLFQNNKYKDDTIKMVSPLCDISKEEYYYSSGVIYCKDAKDTHKLFELWHQHWLDGVAKGINIDQPSFAKANINMGHIIQPIDDVYNCVLYTQNNYLSKAVILHISKLTNAPFVFKPKTMAILREKGISSWVEEMILHVHSTYLPFDYAIKHSTKTQRRKWIHEIGYAASVYGRNVDNSYGEWEFKVGIQPLIKGLLKIGLCRTGIAVWLLYKRSLLRNKKGLSSNICAME